MNICIIHKGKINTTGIEEYLTDSNYVIRKFSLLEREITALEEYPVDVYIFDITNEIGDDKDYHTMQKIREKIKTTPIVLATNSNETSSYREHMLDVGIDGCIQLPFSKEELSLRLGKLVIRKNTLLFKGTTIDSNDVLVDIRSHTVEKGGKKIDLTKTEYSILFHLFMHKNSLVTSNELSTCLREEKKDTSLALNIHIFNLRKKMGENKLIRTIPNYGFTISETLAII